MGLYTWDDAFKGGFAGFDPRGIDTHFLHCILIEQVQATTTVHKDSCEMESVNDGVEDQCGRTAMTDTGRMVPAIKSDRTRRPWVELWGDWLHRIDIP